MKQPTDEELLAAIEQAKKLPNQMRIIRCFAVAMLRYRHPIGEKALEAIHEVSDPDSVLALLFLTGFTASGGLGWKQLVKLAGIRSD